MWMIGLVSGHVDLENAIKTAQNVRLAWRIQPEQPEYILLIEQYSG